MLHLLLTFSFELLIFPFELLGDLLLFLLDEVGLDVPRTQASSISLGSSKKSAPFFLLLLGVKVEDHLLKTPLLVPEAFESIT